MRLAEISQRDAVDVFHHEVGQAIVGRAAVEQSRDVRVLQAREDFALRAETAQDFIGIGPALEQFDRNRLAKFRVRARGQPDRAHPAAAELAKQAVGADAPPFVLPQRRISADEAAAISPGIERLGLLANE